LRTMRVFLSALLTVLENLKSFWTTLLIFNKERKEKPPKWHEGGSYPLCD